MKSPPKWPAAASRKRAPKKQPHPWLKAGLMASLCCLALGGGGLFWLGHKPLAMAFSGIANITGEPKHNGSAIFSTEQGLGQSLDRPTARKRYAQALNLTGQGQFAEALRQWQQLTPAYPGLRAWIALHQAQCYSGLGQEGQAQDALSQALQNSPNAALQAMLTYAQGQSFMRAKQWDQARQAFDRLEAIAPQSELDTGAQFYRGQFAAQANQAPQARTFWRQYLQVAPTGTFAELAAQGLAGQSGALSPQENGTIGVAYAAQQRWQDALPYLKKGSGPGVFVALGRSLMKTGQINAGRRVLEAGLRQAPATAEGVNVDTIVDDAIGLLMRNPDPAVPMAAYLAKLSATAHAAYADTLLWQRIQTAPDAQKPALRQQLADQYPDSRWAPECVWELAWQAWQQGQGEKFMALAARHRARYPWAQSAPKILFWKAQWQRRHGHADEARPVLHQLQAQFPGSYYAFRAGQILSGNTYPWQPQPGRAYPPHEQAPWWQLPLRLPVGGAELTPALQELLAIGAGDDVQQVLLAQPSSREPEPDMLLAQGSVARARGDMAGSLRQVRNAADALRKQGHALKDPAWRRLLYPTPYAEPFAQWSRQNGLDPYWAQALARQESYFNPLALSSSHAMGLMQLLPSTAAAEAKTEGIAGFSAPMLFTPEVNIRLGCRYLRYLLTRFNGTAWMAVGGYNGGPNAMARWVAAAGPSAQADPDLFIERIPYGQTRDYVKSVYAHYWNYLDLYAR